MKNKFIKNKNKIISSAGFTIVETLVAIAILAIALTGPLAIVSQSLRSSYFSRDQITAHYLAQEAIEYIRNRRDQNGLQKTEDTEWLDGVTTSEGSQTPGDLLNEFNPIQSSTIKAYLIRNDNGYSIRKCDNGGTSCPPLRYNPSGERIYGVDGAEYPESIFTREIIITKSPQDPDAKREINVSVTVKWHTASINSQASIDERIYNWQLEQAVIATP